MASNIDHAEVKRLIALFEKEALPLLIQTGKRFLSAEKAEDGSFIHYDASMLFAAYMLGILQ